MFPPQFPLELYPKNIHFSAGTEFRLATEVKLMYHASKIVPSLKSDFHWLHWTFAFVFRAMRLLRSRENLGTLPTIVPLKSSVVNMRAFLVTRYYLIIFLYSKLTLIVSSGGEESWNVGRDEERQRVRSEMCSTCQDRLRVGQRLFTRPHDASM